MLCGQHGFPPRMRIEFRGRAAYMGRILQIDDIGNGSTVESHSYHTHEWGWAKSFETGDTDGDPVDQRLLYRNASQGEEFTGNATGLDR